MTTVYSPELLCHDCVGRYVTRDYSSSSLVNQSINQSINQSVHLSNLIDYKTYQSAFDAFLKGLNSQYSLGYSVKIPPMGIIQYSTNDSVFLFHQSWLSINQLTVKSSRSCQILPSNPSKSINQSINHSINQSINVKPSVIFVGSFW